MYSEKESWVPVYLNHRFWDEMASTQRSESMHAYFDSFVHSRGTLKQFVDQYEIALSEKVNKEFIVDFNSRNTQVFYFSHFKWEK